VNKLTIAIVLLLATPALAQAPADVNVRSTRTISAQMPAEGVAQFCVVSPSAPEVPLVCVPAANGAVVVADVTPFMPVGVRTCFRGITISPEGIQSVASANQACGTVPGAPVLQ